MSQLIQAKNLSRYYGQYCAVKDVSFTLSKGEVLGFLGPNGAGKTSTMQMLCGNLAPSAGQIFIKDIDLLDQPKQAKRFLGYLPDTPPLYKELTVKEFLDYCADLHCLSYRRKKSAINSAISRCGLNEVAERLIMNLSKGFQQRVGIAQAILHDPEIIILDEPTVGLDPIQIKDIRSLIKQLGNEHGIILSTHIVSEIQETCTDVQIINQGQLILKESIHDLKSRLNSEAFKIVTRKAIDIDHLAGINSISKIENTGKNSYLIHHSVKHNPIELVAEIIINSHWGLLELTPVKKSIEDVFINLTTSQQEDKS